MEIGVVFQARKPAPIPVICMGEFTLQEKTQAVGMSEVSMDEISLQAEGIMRWCCTPETFVSLGFKPKPRLTA
jgi:hypothetical protein